jgi:5'-nucleotidase
MKKSLILPFLFMLLACGSQSHRLVLLHTNDTHSFIDSKNGVPGVVDRALQLEHLIDSIGRDNVLLLDCGDFSQGSLYYYIHHGAFEVELMNAMGYDACTIGNHELDYGVVNLAEIAGKASFPFVCANYDFTGTACEGVVNPYTVIERAGLRVGIFGLSPDPSGLVSNRNCAGIRFIHPVEAAEIAVEALQKEGCDVIVCLSHLGWRGNGEYNDEFLVANTRGIDVILGGHSHNLFEKPLYYSNIDGDSVIVQQMGKNGARIGYVTLDAE